MHLSYDIIKDPWPIKALDGHLIYECSHLHKGATAYRFGGTIVLNSNYELASSGIRIILKSQADSWYKIQVRAKLIKGDDLGAFVIVQDCDITQSENKKQTKIHLAKPLIPRSYFFNQNDEDQTQYDIYFKAESISTIAGVLFYHKEMECQLAITMFQVYYLGPNEGLFTDFPEIKRFSDELSTDIRKFGIGVYPKSIQLVILRGEYSDNHLLEMPVYLIEFAGDKIWMKIPDFQHSLSFELDNYPYLIMMNGLDEVQKTLVKKSIKVPIILNSKTGVFEYRADGQILIYHDDCSSLYPKISIPSQLLPLVNV
jgi:hypothetical protein